MRRAGVVLLLAALALGCTPEDPAAVAPSETSDGAVRVGAFNFPESRLLAELYAQSLAAAGFDVADVVELGSREIVEPALQQGRIDVVPEYAGSALVFLEGSRFAANADSQQTHRALAAAFAPRGVTVAEPARAQNHNAIAVTAQTAREHSLATISDLRPVAADMVLGGPPECPQRDVCLAGLRDVYALEFSRFLSLERTEHVTAGLVSGEIDAGVLFTTDPAVLADDLVVLDDDRSLQPAENIVPVVRTAVVDEHGDAALAALNAVSAQLTTRELAELNRAAAEPDAAVGEIAASWLEAHGITP